MKIELREPVPAKYEYRAVEIATGKILMTYQAPGESTLTGIDIEGYPRSSYRVEVHPVEQDS